MANNQRVRGVKAVIARVYRLTRAADKVAANNCVSRKNDSISPPRPQPRIYAAHSSVLHARMSRFFDTPCFFFFFTILYSVNKLYIYGSRFFDGFTRRLSRGLIANSKESRGAVFFSAGDCISGEYLYRCLKRLSLTTI